MRKFTAAAVIGLLAVAAGSPALAGVVNNTNLADASSIPPGPGVYYGSGNSNGNFSVDTEGSVEAGLRAITRFVGAITPTGNVYDAPLGDTTVSGHTGPAWGVDFSVNLNVDGNGSLNVSQIVANLTMQDVVKGTTGTFDVSSIFDNSDIGPGGAVCHGTLALPCTTATSTAFQNSEPALDAFIASVFFADPTASDAINDTYIFTLTVSEVTGLQLARDQIIVNAGAGAPSGVPEPLTLSLFGAGLAGVAAMKRRKKA